MAAWKIEIKMLNYSALLTVATYDVENEFLEADFLRTFLKHGAILCIGGPGYRKTPLSIHPRFHPGHSPSHWQTLNGNLYTKVRIFAKRQHLQEGMDPTSLRNISSCLLLFLEAIRVYYVMMFI